MLLGVFVIFILIAAAIIIVLAVMAVGVLASSSGGSAAGQYCGKCGYSAQGLSADRCPECGSKFSVVGLLGRPPGRRWQPIILTLAWVLLSPFLLFYLAIAVLSNVPQHQITNAFELWHQPKSSAYTRAHIDYNSTHLTGWAGGRPTPKSSDWMASFEQGDFVLDVRGDMLTGIVTVSDGSSSREVEGQLSDRLLADLLVDAFPEADADLLAGEAHDLAGRLAFHVDPNLAELIPTSFEYIGNNGLSNWRTPVPIILISVFIFFSLIWVVGSVGILVWTRRAAASGA